MLRWSPLKSFENQGCGLELAKASKCKLKGLKRMFKKGQGAYFSSGSRPNQTGHSWGYARMASAITGGKASAVDFKIIEESRKKKQSIIILYTPSTLVFIRKKYENMSWVMEYH